MGRVGVVACFLMTPLLLLAMPSAQEEEEIAARIYANECSSKPEKLISWNIGEEFLSLGIGHFTWYPKNYQGPYVEVFPKFIQSLDHRAIVVPEWVKGPCPWDSREAFLQADPRKIQELQAFLLATKVQQTDLIVRRMQNVLPKLLEAAPTGSKELVKSNFERIANAKMGFYILIDYLNFKGEGTSLNEEYKGERWGLLQVLLQMDSSSGKDAKAAFVESAKAVLKHRVDNAPAGRNEGRWLPGWYNRLDTYVR